MRRVVHRLASWMAVVAIALHPTLLGLSPLSAEPVDPFSVICHSGPQADAEQAPALPGTTHSEACDHCTLCSTNALPAAPSVGIAGVIAPAQLLQILRPASDLVSAGTSAHSHFARGPPQPA